MEQLQQLLTTTTLSREEIAFKTGAIHEAVLRASKTLDGADFRSISVSDLESMFRHYDGMFLENECTRALQDAGAELRFRVSERMTRAGGKTTRMIPRGDKASTIYEIAVSSTLLFQSFSSESRTIEAGGITCRDRIEALQRIFEHELLHLVELLVWARSNCAAPRFRTIARNLFGHTTSSHQLMTPAERAHTEHGIKTGDWVTFFHQGKRHVGVVNRVTKRATVLIEDDKGRQYSDGKRYVKCYVPVNQLEPGDAS